jgi:hypothetical protein
MVGELVDEGVAEGAEGLRSGGGRGHALIYYGAGRRRQAPNPACPGPGGASRGRRPLVSRHPAVCRSTRRMRDSSAGVLPYARPGRPNPV